MTAPRSSSRARALDPDALAALEEERDFLLRSIDDLDREHAAGDVADEDHRALRDDYTARAAAALHALEERRAVIAATRRPRRPLRSALTVLAVVVVAGLAGWAVARAAGQRSAGEQATGGVAQSLGQQLTGCLQMSMTAEAPVPVLECYDAILEEHPANAEALTYRSWFLVRAGVADLAWDGLEEAVAVDPEYPDARVFRAIALDRLCRPDEALAELEVLDTLDPSPDIEQLVAQFQLRESIEALRVARDAVPEVAGPPPPIDEVDEAERSRCDELRSAGVLGEPAE